MPAGDGWTLGTDPVTGKQVWLAPGEATKSLGIGYGGAEGGQLNPWDITGYDAHDPGGIARDNLTTEQRLAQKAQKGLYSQDEWSKGVEGRDPLSMRAAALGDYTKMDYANAGPGAMAGYNTIDQTYGNEDRGYQMGLMGRLNDQSMGLGPSLAGEQLKSGMDQSLAAQQAAAASQKGVGQSALAGRNLALMGAQAQGNLAQQSAMARMQEQMNAQGQLGALSSGVRAQDLGVAGQQAALNQQVGLANQGAQNQFSLANAGFQQQAYGSNAQAANAYGLQQGQFNQQAALQNLGAGLAQRQSGDEARQNAYNQTQSAWQTAAGIGSNDKNSAAARAQAQSQADTQERDKWLAAAGTAAMVAASDETGKKDVGDGSGGLKKFLADYGKAGGFGSGLDSLTAAMTGQIAKGSKDAATAPDVKPLDISRTRNAIYKSTMPGAAAKSWGFGTPSSGPGWATTTPAAAQVRGPQDYYYTNDVAPEPPGMAPWGDDAQQQPDVAMPTYAATPSYGAAVPGASPDMVSMQNDLNAIQKKYGPAPSMSDENEKMAMAGGESAIRDMLAKAGTHSYEYKDPAAPGAGEGRFVSPMAQELEKSAIGKSAVIDGPDGKKMVDYGKLSGATLAGLAMHEKRLAKLEKKAG